MTKHDRIILDDEFDAYVDQQVREGNFASASDVVQAGLRLLRDDDARLAALHAALIEGEESGEPVEFDFDAFIEDMRSKYTRSE